MGTESAKFSGRRLGALFFVMVGQEPTLQRQGWWARSPLRGSI